MSNEQKPGDPADRAADGAFGGVQSHRAGYGDDRLARLIGWLRAHPTATLASGEGALLLAENDRLREQLRDTDTKVFHLGEKLAWAERERDQLTSLPAERILAALREPSEGIMFAAHLASLDDTSFRTAWTAALRAAVAAAEQEVGG